MSCNLRGDQLAERLWRRVDTSPGPDSCWPWQGGTSGKSGHGRIATEGHKALLTHRLAYELEVGHIPTGMCVLHTCDNPLCCNPKHLWIGTQLDNIADRHAKGRDAKGTRIGLAKLDEDSVRGIRQKFAMGRTMRSLASEYGIHHSSVNTIVQRRAWKHVL